MLARQVSVPYRGIIISNWNDGFWLIKGQNLFPSPIGESLFQILQ